jgi:hypothetical protein
MQPSHRLNVAPDATLIDGERGRLFCLVRSRVIDDTDHIARQKVYLFHGYNDAVVGRTVTDAANGFYLHYLSDRNRAIFFIRPRSELGTPK